MPLIGLRKRRQAPPAVVPAIVIPRSTHDTWAGPATFHARYGPVRSTPTTLDHTVAMRHGPYTASNPWSSTRT